MEKTDAQKQIDHCPDYVGDPKELAAKLGGTAVNILEGREVHIYFEDFSKIYLVKKAEGWKVY